MGVVLSIPSSENEHTTPKCLMKLMLVSNRIIQILSLEPKSTSIRLFVTSLICTNLFFCSLLHPFHPWPEYIGSYVPGEGMSQHDQI